MKKIIISILTLSTLSLLNANEVTTNDKKEPSVEELSQSFGHMIGQNLASLGFEFDMQNVLKGLQDSIEGKASPLDEQQTVAAITKIQEDAFAKQSEKNLQDAEEFLAKNAKEEGVIEIEKDKLQYKILEEGDGPAVQPHSSPLIRYTGRFINGEEFGASQDSEMITLEETITGFSQGLVGMKKGEKRTLYIHPDNGYGISGFLPPNSLLIFDIEIVEADSPDPVTAIGTDETDEEIAMPNLDLDNQTPIR